MKRTLGLLDTSLILALLIAAGTSVHSYMRHRADSVLIPARSLENWKALIANGQIEGKPDAEFRVAVFSDYECASCRGLYIHLRTLMGQYPDLFSVAWYHRPLPGHEKGRNAAKLAICAGRQDAFVPVHEVLFREQARLTDTPAILLLEESRTADTTAMQKCVANGMADNHLQRDSLIAEQLRVVLTPAIVVDSLLYIGASKALRDHLTMRLRGLAAQRDGREIKIDPLPN